MNTLYKPGFAQLIETLRANDVRRDRRGAAGGGLIFTILAVIGLIVVLAYIF